MLILSNHMIDERKGEHIMPTENNTRRRGIIALVVFLILAVLVILISKPMLRLLNGSSTVYISSQQGYGGEVNLRLSVNEGIIESIHAEGLSETPGIGQKAITQYNETVFAGLSGQPVSEVSAGLDAVSGATITSSAVKAGFEDVIAQAKTIKEDTN